MSTISRILNRPFSTATLHPESIKSISQDLYKERDLRKLVDKFKLHSSTSDSFRNKSGIYTTTVRRLAAAKRHQWIHEILDHQTHFSHSLSKENFTTRLIKLYGVSGMFEHAKKLFDEMPERKCSRTVKSVNALLSACVNSREFGEIDKLFGEMERRYGLKPDVFTYNIAIKGFCESGEYSRAVDKLKAMSGKGLKPDLVSFNTLLDGLYKSGKFDEGERMWERMVVNEKLAPNVRSYNARILGLGKVKKFEEAVRVIAEMEKSGVKPDVFSYGGMIRGYCDVGEVSEVKKWYGELVRKGCVPDRALFESVLLCASGKGDLDWCFELCKELFKRKLLVDGGVLQKVVDGLVKGSRIEEAKKVVEMGKSNDYRLYKLKIAVDA